MAVGPISPNDVESAKAKSIPDEIIEATNELITQKWDGREARFTLKELTELARKKLKMEDNARFKDGQLDIEIPFVKAGWVVTFDKPGYNETYEASFTFKKRRTRGAD